MKYDEGHFNFLLKCIENNNISEWNSWRILNPDIIVNLESAFLQGLDMSGIDLTEANLSGVDFSETKLIHANLKKSILRKAVFEKTELIEANMSYAILENTTFIASDLEGAELLKTDFSSATFNGGSLNGVKAQGAIFIFGDIKNASICQANMNETDFTGSTFNNSNITNSKFEGANLSSCHFSEVDLSFTSFRGANFIGATVTETKLITSDLRAVIVDGKTQFWNCQINDQTNFTGTGLDSARIEPALKETLKGIIRKTQWQTWLSEGSMAQVAAKNLFLKPFWLLSDYGQSTRRIIKWFFFLAFLFALVYWGWGVGEFLIVKNRDPGIIKDLFKDVSVETIFHPIFMVRAFYFSIVTMTTLGFGDMCAACNNSTQLSVIDSFFGHILLIIQVLLGYILLGVMVTRFAVLLTSGGPSKSFSKKGKRGD